MNVNSNTILIVVLTINAVLGIQYLFRTAHHIIPSHLEHSTLDDRRSAFTFPSETFLAADDVSAEWAARQRSAKERAAKARLAKEKAAKELAAKERAAKELALRIRTIKTQEQRDHAALQRAEHAAETALLEKERAAAALEAARQRADRAAQDAQGGGGGGDGGLGDLTDVGWHDGWSPKAAAAGPQSAGEQAQREQEAAAAREKEAAAKEAALEAQLSQLHHQLQEQEQALHQLQQRQEADERQRQEDEEERRKKREAQDELQRQQTAQKEDGSPPDEEQPEQKQGEEQQPEQPEQPEQPPPQQPQDEPAAEQPAKADAGGGPNGLGSSWQSPEQSQAARAGVPVGAQEAASLPTDGSRLGAILRLRAGAPAVEQPKLLRQLANYLKRLGKESFQRTFEEAAVLQSRPQAADVGLLASDPMAEVRSLVSRVRFLNKLRSQLERTRTVATKVALATVWAGNAWSLRRELMPWLAYHTQMGVSRFYVLYDGSDKAVIMLLKGIANVELLLIHTPGGTAAEEAAWKAFIGQDPLLASKPGEHQWVLKQVYASMKAIRMSQDMDWLLRIDAHELLHFTHASSSLDEELARVPAEQAVRIFLPFEAQPEAGNIHNKFEQVSLFRVHPYFMPAAFAEVAQQMRLGTSQSYFHTYLNGKTAVRITALPTFSPRTLGPHSWAAAPITQWEPPADSLVDNAISRTGVLLRYSFVSDKEMTGWAKHVCTQSFWHAATEGNINMVQECLINPYHVDIYLAAAAPAKQALQDFFYFTQVLSEGAPIQCQNPWDKFQGWCGVRHVRALKQGLQASGLLVRLEQPQVVLRNLERHFQELLQELKATQKQRQRQAALHNRKTNY